MYIHTFLFQWQQAYDRNEGPGGARDSRLAGQIPGLLETSYANIPRTRRDSRTGGVMKFRDKPRWMRTRPPGTPEPDLANASV